jgi:glycerol-3-phosphate dehydrogenase (NAD(P)+)
MEVTVIGAGSWGTALSLVLARNGHAVRLAGRPSEDLDILRSARENLRYLPGHILPEGLEVADLDTVTCEGQMAVVAVPSAAVRETLPHLLGAQVVVIASKGLEATGDGVLHEVVSAAYPGVGVVALSGPNLAVELAAGIPTVAVAASESAEASETVRCAFMCRSYRIYLSDDIRGVELAGALKNVLAIGAGISDGLGFGDNTKGALLSRGLNEMARLGLAMGARVDTFLGIAGVGDLFATAASTLSRNYRVGYALGTGTSLGDAVAALGQVAEGVPTCDVALRLARTHGIQTPIMQAIHDVMHGRVGPRVAVDLLMERTPKREGVFGE